MFHHRSVPAHAGHGGANALLTWRGSSPHKRIDGAIEAFRGIEAELVVVGRGPWLERLRSTAPPNVQFAGVVWDDRLRELYRGAIAFVSPQRKSSASAMVEAQACGTPVIAPRAGGALDIVRDSETGVLTAPTPDRSRAPSAT